MRLDGIGEIRPAGDGGQLLQFPSVEAPVKPASQECAGPGLIAGVEGLGGGAPWMKLRQAKGLVVAEAEAADRHPGGIHEGARSDLMVDASLEKVLERIAAEMDVLACAAMAVMGR